MSVQVRNQRGVICRHLRNNGEDVLNELIKVCISSSARDLLKLQRNSVPPLICPIILPTAS